MEEDLLIQSQYITLDIKSHPKITSILRYKGEKTIKERPRTLSHLSLNSNKYLNLSENHLHKLTANLKQLKSLTSLSIPLCYLPRTEQGIDRLISSIKHLKNLQVLHFIQPEVLEATLTNEQTLSLYKALNRLKSLPQLQIKVSLFSFALKFGQDSSAILSSFSQVKMPILLELSCNWDFGVKYLEEWIGWFKKSVSLEKLSIMFAKCEFENFANLQKFIESLPEIKSLKVSRFYFKDCRKSSNAGSLEQSLVPYLTKAVQTQDIEIILDNSFVVPMLFKQNSFLKSIKDLHDSHTIQAKFIQGDALIKMVRTKLLTLYFVSVLILGIIAIAK